MPAIPPFNPESSSDSITDQTGGATPKKVRFNLPDTTQTTGSGKLPPIMLLPKGEPKVSAAANSVLQNVESVPMINLDYMKANKDTVGFVEIDRENKTVNPISFTRAHQTGKRFDPKNVLKFDLKNRIIEMPQSMATELENLSTFQLLENDKESSEFKECLKEICQHGGFGVVVVDDELFSAFIDEVNQFIEEQKEIEKEVEAESRELPEEEDSSWTEWLKEMAEIVEAFDGEKEKPRVDEGLSLKRTLKDQEKYFKLQGRLNFKFDQENL